MMMMIRKEIKEDLMMEIIMLWWLRINNAISSVMLRKGIRRWMKDGNAAADDDREEKRKNWVEMDDGGVDGGEVG